MSFIPDLFKGIGNANYDLARVSAAWVLFLFGGVFLADSVMRWLHGQFVPDYTSVGLGFASVMAGAGGLIFAKDSARTQAVASVAKASTEAAAAGAPPPPLITGETVLDLAGMEETPTGAAEWTK